MQTFVVRRKFTCRCWCFPFSECNDLPFEIHHGPRVRPALEGGFSHQVVVDAGKQRVDENESILTLPCYISSRTLVGLYFLADILAQDAHVPADMIEKREYDLADISASK